MIPQESFGVVTIQVQQIANLAGFELELSFNPAVITVIDVTEGDFLKQSGGETFSPDPEMDNINGTVSMTVGRLTPGGANGAGSLAQIRFQAKTTGQSPLTLTTVKLADTRADQIIATFSSASITVTEFPPWDVNQDGGIDIFDIVIVGQHFGQHPPQDQRADVNRDGQVNVWDLVLLGSHLGESMHPAAPAFSPSAALFLPSIEKLTAMQQARAALEALPEKSSGAEIALAVLRSWLAQNESHVTTTQLLPNYPNPFNPETWIPYQLAVDTEVYITIYDARGKRVRRFNRGHQKAGAYVNRQRAAYWNGRSEIGELVSSGLYFYHLRAGDFTAIERMVILK